MSLTFFAKSKDNKEVTTTEGERTVGSFTPFTSNDKFSYRQFRLLRSKFSPEELLERLMRNIENTSGLARENYLEQMLIFFGKHPGLVNRVPRTFHSNPLELVLQLGNIRIAKALLAMNAQVRPENLALYRKMEPLLFPSKTPSCKPRF